MVVCEGTDVFAIIVFRERILETAFLLEFYGGIFRYCICVSVHLVVLLPLDRTREISKQK